MIKKFNPGILNRKRYLLDFSFVQNRLRLRHYCRGT